MILLIKHRVLETHSVCAFSGDKDVCELCKGKQKGKASGNLFLVCY